jgi:hypothetical protein
MKRREIYGVEVISAGEEEGSWNDDGEEIGVCEEV